jgi:hypothetical protein
MRERRKKPEYGCWEACDLKMRMGVRELLEAQQVLFDHSFWVWGKGWVDCWSRFEGGIHTQGGISQ